MNQGITTADPAARMPESWRKWAIQWAAVVNLRCFGILRNLDGPKICRISHNLAIISPYITESYNQHWQVIGP